MHHGYEDATKKLFTENVNDQFILAISVFTFTISGSTASDILQGVRTPSKTAVFYVPSCSPPVDTVAQVPRHIIEYMDLDGIVFAHNAISE